MPHGLNKKTQPHRERITQLILDGVPDGEIVAMTGACISLVERMRRANGIRRRSNLGDIVRGTYLILNTNLSWGEIAEKMECNHHWVGYLAGELQKAGFNFTPRKRGRPPNKHYGKKKPE